MRAMYSVGCGDSAITIAAHVDASGNILADVNANRLGGWFDCTVGQVLGQTEEAGGEVVRTWEANDGRPRYWPEAQH